MRKIAITAVVGGLLGMLSAQACSSSSDTATGAGGATTTTGAGGATTSTTSTTGQGGGSSGCVEVTNVTGFGRGQSSFGGVAEPNFGAKDPDYVQLYLPPMAKGKLTLAPLKNVSVCGDTDACIVASQDATDMGVAATFLAKGGSLDIANYDGEFLLTGNMADVTFEEVTIDDMTGDVTPVKAGKCVHIAKFAVDIKPPVTGWKCNPAYYDETKAGAAEIFCDCNCGAADPDCSNAMNKVDGCLDGQTCGAKFTCEGAPKAWTCAPAKFNGGKGNGCDCGCGAVDPDCELMPSETVTGCKVGEVCGVGKCIPAAWKCSLKFYDEDKAGPTDKFCDCGCGVADPDCTDAKLASCNFCDDMGSCSVKACDMMPTIDPMNNAVCQ